MISKATYKQVCILLNNGVEDHVNTVHSNVVGDSEYGIFSSVNEKKYISVKDDLISGIYLTLAGAQKWLSSK